MKEEHVHVPEVIPAIAKVLIGKASACSYRSRQQAETQEQRQEQAASMRAYADALGVVLGNEQAGWKLLELLESGAHNVRAIYRTLTALEPNAS